MMLSITLMQMYGVTIITDISSVILVNKLNLAFGLGFKMEDQLTLKSTPTLANGAQFGEEKASIFPVLYLILLLPLSSVLAKKIMTSGILYSPAMSRDPKKLSMESFLSSSMGI